MGACSGGIAPPFLTSVLHEAEWSASRPGRFIIQDERPQYPLARRLGGTQSRSGRCGIEKNILPLRESNTAVQPVARRYTDSAIPAPPKI
jgi:hypothetical protein